MISLNLYQSLNTSEFSERDYSHFENDKKNLQKLLQMALEVELFTIPLYMSGMYSIEGYHQINTKKSNFYQGRQWPGAAPKFRADIANDPKQDAFNKVFKVFIEEMLHLQIAANLCNAYGNENKENVNPKCKNNVNAKFKDNGIINEDYSWSCYGDDKTVIPGIIDFTDLKEGSVYKDTKVKLDALNERQIKLFLAIESSEHDLQNEIDTTNRKKYEHTIPFNVDDNLDGIMFGSISGLYTSIIMYLLIEYKNPPLSDKNKDHNFLYKLAFQNASIQRDHFNKIPSNTKTSEYPELQTNLLGETKETITIEKLLRMIDGILDQGEGEPLYVLIFNIIKHIKEQGGHHKNPPIQNLLTIRFDGKNAVLKYADEIGKELITDPTNKYLSDRLKEIGYVSVWLLSGNYMSSSDNVSMAVSPDNQSNDDALAKNHPSYDDKGNQVVSSSVAARGGANAKLDHYEIFEAVQKLLKDGKVKTWYKVHYKEEKGVDGKITVTDNKISWSNNELITNPADYEENCKNYPQLPTAEEIAKAMNEVSGKKEMYKTLLSQATTGTLKGLLMGMEDYWSNPKGQFPSPAMGGSGDRMSICWALLGKTPDLSVAPDKKITKKNGCEEDHAQDYHACQGLYLPKVNEDELDSTNPWVKNGEFGCASPAVYHSCKGSNTCKSESGCGYVQAYEGGANCGASAGGSKYSDPVYISAPGANNCSTTGGCAVPISALQMFPAPYGEEQLMKYKNGHEEETINYQKGELVYDVAWKVYTKRYKKKFGRLPKKPNTNFLRLIFPPST